MKVSTFSGFTQEKIEFILNGFEFSEKGAELAKIFDLLPLWKYVPRSALTGRPPIPRLNILKLFILKAVLNISQNKQLRDFVKGSEELWRLCGWVGSNDIPSEPTLSRVFKDFANMGVPEMIHTDLIKNIFKGKIIGHISRDATAVLAREKPVKKVKVKKVPGKRGRPKKGTPPQPKTPTRIERQVSQELDEMVSELPVACDTGYKINSQGNPSYWRGYKLHADWSDEGIPVSYLVTSASMHDSQASIPLTIMSSKRTQYLYELMDAGYDVVQIQTMSERHNHAPIIKPNNRRSKVKRVLESYRARRYRIRSVAERGFGALKDDFRIEGSRFRGDAKVKAHIGFAMVVLTMRKIFQYENKFSNILENLKKTS